MLGWAGMGLWLRDGKGAGEERVWSILVGKRWGWGLLVLWCWTRWVMYGMGLVVRLNHVGRSVIATVVKVTADWTFIGDSVSDDPAVPLDTS